MNVIEQARMLRDSLNVEMEKAVEVRDEFEKVWVELDDKAVKELVDKSINDEEDKNVVAIDGSRRYQEFQVHVPFYVKAVAIRYPSTVGGHIYIAKEWPGLVKPPEMGKERSLLYMEAQEAALAVNALENMRRDGIRFVLADGSFTVPIKCEGRSHKCVNECLKDMDVEKFMFCIWSNVMDADEAKKIECEFKRQLYKSAARKGEGKIVYVSKKYYSKQLFKHQLEDAQIITALSKGAPGYTKPQTKKLNMGEVTLTYSYVRLSRDKGLIYVEVPGSLNEKRFEEILGLLLYYSINGYPRPLTVAHKLSQISENVWEITLWEMGLWSEKTGREAL